MTVHPVMGQPSADMSQGNSWVDLRVQVADRIRELTARHTDAAWQSRHTNPPIAPYALAYFYAEPTTRNGPPYVLRTATRLFLDGPEVSDAVKLLRQLTAIAEKFAQSDRGLDPRRDMSTRCDEMNSNACYIGVALSTLDTPRGGWRERIRDNAHGPLDIPDRCIVFLVDGTVMLADRRPHREAHPYQLWSTTSLNPSPYMGRVRSWKYAGEIRTRLQDDYSQKVYDCLYDLHRVLRGDAQQ